MSARYQPVAPIAHGGMAKLELSRMRGEQGFAKYVAVKRILPQWAEEHEFVAMFQDEARLIARLDHPNIVHVYDFARDDEGYFIAMEYIHGPSLRGLLAALGRQDAVMPIRHAVTIGIGIAAGLSHAHTRTGDNGRGLGIIHRDVSPTNVLVTHEGGVKLVDFGIAKAVSNKHTTRGNARKGKVAYMSPEQCKAAPLDARSDLFALGAVLYELLTGRRAFDGDDELAVMNAVVNHDVTPPSEHRPDLPPALEDIVLHALQRDPDQRPPSARAIERALEELDAVRPSRAALGDWVSQTVGRSALPWEALASEVEELPSTDDVAGPTRAKGVAPRVDERPTVAAPHESEPPSSAGGRRWAALALLAMGGVALGASRFAGSEATAEPRPVARPAESPRVEAPQPPRRQPPAADADRARQAEVVPAVPEPPPPDEATTPDIAAEAPDEAPVEAPVAAPAETAVEPKPEPPPKRKRSTKKRPPKPEPAEVEPPTAAFDPDGLSPRRRRP